MRLELFRHVAAERALERPMLVLAPLLLAGWLAVSLWSLSALCALPALARLPPEPPASDCICLGL